MDGGPEPRDEPDRPGRLGTGGPIAPVRRRAASHISGAGSRSSSSPSRWPSPSRGPGWSRRLARPSSRPAATASPTRDTRPDTAPRTPPGLSSRRFCTDPTRWLVASTEHWRGQAVRVWRALDPADECQRPGRSDDPGRPGRVRGPRPPWLVRPGRRAGPPGRSGVRRDVAADRGRSGYRSAWSRRCRPAEPSAFGAMYAPPASRGRRGRGGPGLGLAPPGRPVRRATSPGRALPTDGLGSRPVRLPLPARGQRRPLVRHRHRDPDSPPAATPPIGPWLNVRPHPAYARPGRAVGRHV